VVEEGVSSIDQMATNPRDAKMRWICLLIAVTGFMLLPEAALAKGGPKWKGGFHVGKTWKKGPGHWKRGRWSRGRNFRGRKFRGKWRRYPQRRFTNHDFGLIRRYYRGRRPGCARRFPPGIRMNLARGKSVPPGIRKRYGCRLSPRLVAQLPPRPGYVYYWFGDDLVLISRTTNFIVDIARHLF
jgi:hypothetical protein